MDFYCVFVRTEMNLIAFLGPRNCVNTPYSALSGAMMCLFRLTIVSMTILGMFVYKGQVFKVYLLLESK